MPQKMYFEGFSEEKQKEYEAEIRQRFGDNAFFGAKEWNDYDNEQKLQIQAESEAIFTDLAAILSKFSVAALDFQGDPEEAMLTAEKMGAIEEAQPVLARWHLHLHHFYEPTKEHLRGLSQLYGDHPDFRAKFTRLHPALPEFLQLSIGWYCDHL